MPIVNHPSGVRASEEDREGVAAEIREHFALGRMDVGELDRRLGAAYAAVTVEELQELRADLPRIERTASLFERALGLAHRLAPRAGVALLPFAACTVVWLATGAQGGFWPMWVGLAGILRLAFASRPVRIR